MSDTLKTAIDAALAKLAGIDVAAMQSERQAQEAQMAKAREGVEALEQRQRDLQDRIRERQRVGPEIGRGFAAFLKGEDASAALDSAERIELELKETRSLLAGGREAVNDARAAMRGGRDQVQQAVRDALKPLGDYVDSALNDIAGELSGIFAVDRLVRSIDGTSSKDDLHDSVFALRRRIGTRAPVPGQLSSALAGAQDLLELLGRSFPDAVALPTERTGHSTLAFAAGVLGERARVAG